jgi:hypothetical protein
VTWPAWWEWEIELTPHLEKRMEDRDFTEVDLRAMLQRARGYKLAATRMTSSKAGS